jgi:hypothetical protein
MRRYEAPHIAMPLLPKVKSHQPIVLVADDDRR